MYSSTYLDKKSTKKCEFQKMWWIPQFRIQTFLQLHQRSGHSDGLDDLHLTKPVECLVLWPEPRTIWLHVSTTRQYRENMIIMDKHDILCFCQMFAKAMYEPTFSGLLWSWGREEPNSQPGCDNATELLRRAVISIAVLKIDIKYALLSHWKTETDLDKNSKL